MTQFRKKPVTIEATQWFKNGDHPEDYAEPRSNADSGRLYTVEFQKENGWEGQVVHYYRRPERDGKNLCKYCQIQMHDHGWIDTKEGGHIVCPGDWVITGVEGERYPCKPSIFEATYEPVDA